MSEAVAQPRRTGTRLLVLVPLAVFAALAGVFGARILEGGDTSAIPSVLIGRAAPAATFRPLLAAMPGVDPAAFQDRVTLVNVFASWCAPCRVEHPKLLALAAQPGLTLAGIDYKDRPEAGRAFLIELGNPYDAVGVDAAGRGAIDWGVTGVPETFLIGPDGVVRGRQVGPIDDAALAGPFGNAIRDLLAARPAS